MKKLIIVLAAVALGFSAQAASCKWSFASGATLASLNSVVQGGATLYLFQYSSTSDVSTGRQGILTSLRANKNYDVTSASGYLDSFTLGADGKLAATSKVYDSSDSANNYFVAIILADDASGNSYMYQSAQAAKKGNQSVEQAVALAIGQTAMKDLDTAWSATPGWYQYAAAPEPTSGILMLVGLGALALRRRRA